MGTCILCMKLIVSDSCVLSLFFPTLLNNFPNSFADNFYHHSRVCLLEWLMSCLQSIIFQVSSSYTVITKCAGSLPPTGNGLFFVSFAMFDRCSLVDNLVICLVLSLLVLVCLYQLSSLLLIFSLSPLSYTIKYSFSSSK